MTTVLNTLLLIKSIHHYLILFANTAERLNMTEGISKERLIEIKQSLPYGQARLNLDRLIKAECKELDPWLPIDENTPKDRKLLFLFENCYISSGYWDATYDSWETVMDVHIESLSGKITHYKLLK